MFKLLFTRFANSPLNSASFAQGNRRTEFWRRVPFTLKLTAKKWHNTYFEIEAKNVNLRILHCLAKAESVCWVVRRRTRNASCVDILQNVTLPWMRRFREHRQAGLFISHYRLNTYFICWFVFRIFGFLT